MLICYWSEPIQAAEEHLKRKSNLSLEITVNEKSIAKVKKNVQPDHICTSKLKGNNKTKRKKPDQATHAKPIKETEGEKPKEIEHKRKTPKKLSRRYEVYRKWRQK